MSSGRASVLSAQLKRCLSVSAPAPVRPGQRRTRRADAAASRPRPVRSRTAAHHTSPDFRCQGCNQGSYRRIRGVTDAGGRPQALQALQSPNQPAGTTTHSSRSAGPRSLDLRNLILPGGAAASSGAARPGTSHTSTRHSLRTQRCFVLTLSRRTGKSPVRIGDGSGASRAQRRARLARPRTISRPALGGPPRRRSSRRGNGSAQSSSPSVGAGSGSIQLPMSS